MAVLLVSREPFWFMAGMVTASLVVIVFVLVTRLAS